MTCVQFSSQSMADVCCVESCTVGKREGSWSYWRLFSQNCGLAHINGHCWLELLKRARVAVDSRADSRYSSVCVRISSMHIHLPDQAITTNDEAWTSILSATSAPEVVVVLCRHSVAARLASTRHMPGVLSAGPLFGHMLYSPRKYCGWMHTGKVSAGSPYFDAIWVQKIKIF